MTEADAGSPLAQKLELRRGVRTWFGGLPESVRAELDPARLGVDEHQAPSAGLEYVHLFCTDRATLEHQLAAVHDLIDAAAIVWVSWPSRGTDRFGEEAVRAVAEPLGLAEVGQCQLNHDWCAMKLMIRRSLG